MIILFIVVTAILVGKVCRSFMFVWWSILREGQVSCLDGIRIGQRTW